MSFTRANLTGWAVGDKLLTSQINQIDIEHAKAVDKTSAGDTVSGVLVFASGSGITAQSGFTGNVNLGASLAVQGTLIIGGGSGFGQFNVFDTATFESGSSFNIASGAISNITISSGSSFTITSGVTSNITVTSGSTIHGLNGSTFTIDSGANVHITVTNTNGLVSNNSFGVIATNPNGINSSVAGGISTFIAGGISPQVSRGITDGGHQSGISTTTQGGIELNGGDNDYPRFGSPRTFYRMFPFGSLPFVMPLDSSGNNNFFVSVGNFYGAVAAASISGPSTVWFWLPNLHNGATINSVDFLIGGSFLSGQPNASAITISFFRTSMFAGSYNSITPSNSTLIAQLTGVVGVTQQASTHTMGSLSETIDTYNQGYSVKIDYDHNFNGALFSVTPHYTVFDMQFQ